MNVSARVYPRVCGGTSASRVSPGLLAGLSPRVRGNPVEDVGGLAAGRSIPACAGEPGGAEDLASGERVYPRVCGGTDQQRGLYMPPNGLSPRVRGNLPLGEMMKPKIGSIPACAGEPIVRRLARGGHRVYPRVCGGTPGLAVLEPTTRGLSPRVRGNRQTIPVINGSRRSIPACAGEPATVRALPSPKRVYPRVCGGTSFPFTKL